MLSTAEPGRSKAAVQVERSPRCEVQPAAECITARASTQLPLWGPASVIYESAAFSKEKDTKSVCLLN